MKQISCHTYRLRMTHSLHASSVTLQDNLQTCWQALSPALFAVQAVYQPDMHDPQQAQDANVLSKEQGRS